MKPLTPEQLSAIQSLISHPHIETVRLEFFKGMSYISIISTVGAEFETVDKALKGLTVFPNLEYQGEPSHYLNPVNNKETELYMLDWDGETLISLSMVKEPEPTVWTIDEIMRREG